MQNKTSVGLNALIVLLFFLSGVAGLVYQVVWVRMLTLFVGGGTFSISIVLTVFMGGLALGSMLAARIVDRVQEPRGLILAYGLLECIIGVYGLLFPAVLSACRPVYAGLYGLLHTHAIAYNCLSSSLSIALLILPTTLMGATLPVLCRFYVHTLPNMGTRTGRLYGINTIGAAIGALACGFWMIRWLGMAGTVTAAVAVNLGIGLLCVALSSPLRAWRSLRALRGGSREAKALRTLSGLWTSPVVPFLLLSGFCSMSYEVIWTKLLALLVGPTTYSFTIVLFTFITGLALGSILFGWWADRTDDPFRLLIGTQLAAAGLALLVSHVLGNSQMFFAKLLYEFRENFGMVETSKAAVLFLFMLGPTLLLGAVFPLAVKIHTREADRVGASVGRLYALNTVGAVLGSLCAGFVLVPTLGKAHSISLLCAVQAGVAGFVYLLVRGDHRGRGVRVACAAALVALCFALPRWDSAALAQAKYHRVTQIQHILEGSSYLDTFRRERADVTGRPGQEDILFIDDGIGGFVAVGRSVNSVGATNTFLSISGKIDASSMEDLHTMTLSGQVPMLFHPNARTAMVVGLATGITAGEMLHYPVESVDVLEISPEVVKACAYFNKWNNGVLRDPRAHMIMQDARTHIALTDRTYDVIMSEPSNPWMAGVANLFTVDYFRKVRARLNPGGIFVQWFHTYQTNWDAFSMLGRSLLRVFPRTVLLKTSTMGSDYLLVCFRDPEGTLDLSVAERNLQYAQRSRNMEMRTPKVVFPLLVAENLAQIFGPGPMHTDNFPLLEYLAPTQVYSGGEEFSRQILSKRKVTPKTANVLHSFTNTELQLDLARFMASMNIHPFGLVDLRSASPEQVEEYRRVVQDFCRRIMVADYDDIRGPRDRALCLATCEEAIRSQLEEKGVDLPQAARARAFFDLAGVHVARGEYDQAVPLYSHAFVMLPSYFAAQFNLGAAYEQLGRFERAVDTFASLVRRYPRSPALSSRLAANHLRLGRQSEALHWFEQALHLDPRYAPALVAAGAIYGTRGDFDTAAAYSSAAIDADPTSIKAYQNLAIALARLNRLEEAFRWVAAGLAIEPDNKALLSLRAQIAQAMQQ